MKKKYKSLRGGSVKTKFPKFQPIRPKKNMNTEDKNRKEEESIIDDNNNIIIEDDINS